MILQALTQLYHRLKDEEGNPYGLPVSGYSVQNITFRIVLNPDGSLVEIQDARDTITETTKTGKIKTKQVPRQIVAPDLGGRSRNTKAYFLCDKLSYLTGFDKDPSRTDLASEHFSAAKARHLGFREAIQTEEYRAICSYFERFEASAHLEALAEAARFASTGVGVFRVLPSQKDAHENPDVLSFWLHHGESVKNEDETCVMGQCLVTGEEASLARLHEPKMKGFGQDSPILVSFNDPAYQSYGKDQSFNAPVSQAATFAYCNALNALLSGPQSHRHRVTIGDTTTVFWTEKRTTTESLFASVLSGQTEKPHEPTTIEDQALHQKLDALLSTLRTGGGASLGELGDDPDTKFYLLGLSKVTKSRLAVRFWHASTISGMLGRLRDHYQNLALIRRADPNPFHAPEFPSAQRLLDQTARERKAVSPLLGGQLMQAILHGTRYPMTLYQGVLNRLRANDEINHLKTAILKAILIRNHQINMTEALDTSRTEPAYHLGRLFAVYETAQKHAHDWKLERTIRETMYSAASATPLSVFGRLERLHHHHTSKKSHPIGSSESYADIVAEVNQHFKGTTPLYPATLNIVEQSLFAVGYYHQLHHFRDLQDQAKDKRNQTTQAPASSPE